MVKNLNSFQKIIKYNFKNKKLLKQALTHKSYSSINNERFEFIGDAILNYTIAKMLYDYFPHSSEGILSRLRSALVNQETLVKLAKKINLHEFLFLGQGELKTKGYNRPSILSDTMEAIFAAISLDSNFNTAETFIKNFYFELIENLNPDKYGKDPKSILQEKLQFYKHPIPKYNLIKIQEEKDNKKTFTIECSLEKLNYKCYANANNKKLAQRKAAQIALNYIEKNINLLK